MVVSDSDSSTNDFTEAVDTASVASATVTAVAVHDGNEYRDTLTAYKLRDGDSSIQIISERDSLVLSSDKDGNIASTLQSSSEITYTVWDGGIPLQFVTNDTTPGAGKFSVTGVDVTPTSSITLDDPPSTVAGDATTSPPTPGEYSIKPDIDGSYLNMDGDTAEVKLTFKIQGLGSTDVLTQTKKFQYAKSKAGAPSENIILSTDSQIFRKTIDSTDTEANI